MSNGFPYWQFHNDRWLAGKVSSFGLQEQALFLHLCILAWTAKGAFKVSSTTVARRFNVARKWVDDTLAEMAADECGILVSDGNGYRIKFIDCQLAEMADHRQQCSRAGKASAAARKAVSPPVPLSPEEEKSRVEYSSALDSVERALNGRSTTVEAPHAHAMPQDGWSWDQVRTAAAAAEPTVAVREDQAQAYCDVRTAKGWTDLKGNPVARTWAALLADLRTWKRNQGKHDGAGPGGYQKREETPTQIRERIEAVNGMIQSLPSYANDRTPEQAARHKELVERRRALQRQLAGVEK